MSLWIRGAVAILLAVATALLGYAVSGPAHAESARAELSSPGPGPGLVTVNVYVHYSHYSLSALHVHAGTTVRFLIHNQDPIAHEFIVGDPTVQALHEHGSEHVHPPVPGEVSVLAGQIGETFYRFDEPGRVLFACHLPGHFAYGMHGWVTVT
jgi:uncharacterized cupredoxin-like copper-binding protein